MNFRILCFSKILQPPSGWRNLDRTITYTRFHRIKGGVPPPITLIEWMKFKDFYESCSVTLGAGYIKFHQLFQRSLVMGGHSASASAFYSVKLCVMINFSLRHNVLCFSFFVVLYSMYSLYAIIKVVLLNERDCHV